MDWRLAMGPLPLATMVMAEAAAPFQRDLVTRKADFLTGEIC